jgi:DNA-directed RNA polymerase specialized sigma24 family protein
MTKEELKEYISIKKEITDLEERIEEKRATSYCPKGQVIDDTPKGQKTDFDTIGRVVCSINGLEMQRLKKVVLLMEKELEIENAIEKLDSRLRRLMRYKYFDGFTLEKICCLMNYGWTHLNNLHSEALNKIKSE